MIRNSMQLKAKIKQLTEGDSKKTQIYLRNFFMERFLERISESEYRDKFILKGGILVASIMGLDFRSTMDIDSTVKNFTLNEEEASKIIDKIINTKINDSVNFEITKASEIMGEHDYPGLRYFIHGSFDGIEQAIRLDLSISDIITPKAIVYEYKFMFEDRIIKLLTYNLETLLAEKLETIISLGSANTRMRDFYDIYILTISQKYDLLILKDAIKNTSIKRGTQKLIKDYKSIIKDIKESLMMDRAWNNFKRQSYFVGDLKWSEVLSQCEIIINNVLSNWENKIYLLGWK